MVLAGLTMVLSIMTAQVPIGVKTDCSVRGEVTLIGSERELLQENRTADKCRVSRIRDKANLEWFIGQGYLVPLRDGDDEPYEVSPDLAEADPDDPEIYLYARPWTRQFVEDLSARMRTETGVRLRITSLVRHEDYQRQLRTFNSNAARDSTHPTGATVDISMSDYTWRQKNWLRKAMLALEGDGLVEATEERSNLCMHVFVHPAYGWDEDAPEEVLSPPLDPAPEQLP